MDLATQSNEAFNLMIEAESPKRQMVIKDRLKKAPNHDVQAKLLH